MHNMNISLQQGCCGEDNSCIGSQEVRDIFSEALHSLYHINIISQIKSRRMRWAEHVARMGEERKVYKVLREARRKETTWKTKT
jgi:hypothetical protein